MFRAHNTTSFRGHCCSHTLCWAVHCIHTCHEKANLLETCNGDAGFGALGRFDGQAWKIWRKGDLPQINDEVEVMALSADEQKQIWLATWGGGPYVWYGAKWRSLAAEPNAPSGNVLALMPHNGAMWVGGALNGRLFSWTKSGWTPHKIDGLSGSVNDIYFTGDDALWLATSDGLLRISPEAVAVLR